MTLRSLHQLQEILLNFLCISFIASLTMDLLFKCQQFGRGDHGRLGYGRKVTTGHPMEVPITLPPPKDRTEGRWCAKFVACGGRHTLAIATWVDGAED